MEINNIHQGYLILVNDRYPLECDNDDKLVDVDNKIKLNRVVFSIIEKIKEELKMHDDVVYVSGFRSHDEQYHLYQDCLLEYGIEYTTKFVAKVDCSEHQTGLAVDLGEKLDVIDYICPHLPYDGKFKKLRKALLENGFIERYQEHKKDITRIASEPWHFRYVGFPHSLIMDELDLCLEEYIEYLKQFTACNPLVYRDCIIFYVPEECEVKVEGCYGVSGNNVDGWVVTKYVQR